MLDEEVGQKYCNLRDFDKDLASTLGSFSFTYNINWKGCREVSRFTTIPAYTPHRVENESF